MITGDAEQSTITLPRFRKIIWLMPAAYVLHIVEEYVGGFPAWVTHDVHGRFDNAAFAANNVAFMLILLTLVYVNYRRTTPLRGFLLVVFASGNLFWDALFHLFMTPILDRYSPGRSPRFSSTIRSASRSARSSPKKRSSRRASSCRHCSAG